MSLGGELFLLPLGKLWFVLVVVFNNKQVAAFVVETDVIGE